MLMCQLLDRNVTIFFLYYFEISPPHLAERQRCTMSIAIEMKPLLNLDCLPPDIIRRVIHLGSDSATEMRLVRFELCSSIYRIMSHFRFL